MSALRRAAAAVVLTGGLVLGGAGNALAAPGGEPPGGCGQSCEEPPPYHGYGTQEMKRYIQKVIDDWRRSHPPGNDCDAPCAGSASWPTG